MWQKFAKKVAGIQATIVLAVIYVILIFPVGIIINATKRKVKKNNMNESFWLPRPKIHTSKKTARKQY